MQLTRRLNADKQPDFTEVHKSRYERIVLHRRYNATRYKVFVFSVCLFLPSIFSTLTLRLTSNSTTSLNPFHRRSTTLITSYHASSTPNPCSSQYRGPRHPSHQPCHRLCSIIQYATLPSSHLNHISYNTSHLYQFQPRNALLALWPLHRNTFLSLSFSTSN